MTNDQIAAKLEELGAIMHSEFAKIDARLSSLEKHSLARSDVHAAVFQGLAFAAAAIVGTVVVLNALGAFP